MNKTLTAGLRRLVAERASHRCEYCLIHEDDTFFGCEVDHIISRKHGGGSDAENLAYACLTCNRQKGSDIGSLPLSGGDYVRLFNPRNDKWSSHFGLRGSRIETLTPIGEATARLLELNSPGRLLEREALIASGRYPVP